MQLQPGLTKENFFNELMAKYPKAMKIFCDWIDEYKQAVNWGSMFAANENAMQLHSSKYKFHEIPYAMQVGILIEFLLNHAYKEADGDESSIIMLFPDDGSSDDRIEADFISWLNWKEEILVANN